MSKFPLFFSGILVYILLLACIRPESYNIEIDLSPKADSIIYGINWNPQIPGKNGKTDREYRKMHNRIQRLYPSIQSVIVVHEGRLFYEHYFNGTDSFKLFNLCSVTKTVTSALTGIAIDKEYLEGTEQKVFKFFPEYSEDVKSKNLAELTISDLLTMTDGLNRDDRTDLENESFWNDPVQYCLKLSFRTRRGERFNYSTLNSQLLSAIITRSTGMSELEFADRFLFVPLDITDKIWYTDGQGNNIGGASLYLQTRDMAKIGQLYLNKGKWGEHQLISPEWIEKSTHKYSDGGPPHGEAYGYHIWVTELNTMDAYFAGGYGGQFIYVVPKLELVVAITSALDRHREYHRDIIGKFIVPAIEAL